MDIEKIALETGVLVSDGEYTYWTEGDAVEALTRFAQVIAKQAEWQGQKKAQIQRRGY